MEEQTVSVAPRRTPLGDWHAANGGSMHEFAGYLMPIQYSSVLSEHLATRAGAGLFDVCHMGRFLVRGPQAVPFLRQALTNDAARLPEAGGAHYTLIATAAGDALDDAFLYRLGPEEYLLVVNAANRARDWDQLQRLGRPFAGAQLRDATDDLAMLALQGPQAELVLARLLAARGRGQLPPRRRNALGRIRIDDGEIIVARTGYTGEPVSLELFPAAAQVVSLWEQLLACGHDAGVCPVGLGARDTLRLEAGLPLYGHELGTGPDGLPIPIWALGELAGRGVDLVDPARPFVGRQALQRQQDELTAAVPTGGTASDRRLVPRLVCRLAVLDPAGAGPGLNPVRHGHLVFAGDEPVGWVTSGTVVPYWRAGGSDSGRRAIALAYLDSDRVRRPALLRLSIDKGRGPRLPAQIVRAHLRAEGDRVRAILYPRGELA